MKSSNTCVDLPTEIRLNSEAPSFESVMAAALGGGGLGTFAYAALGVSAVLLGMAAGAAMSLVHHKKTA